MVKFRTERRVLAAPAVVAVGAAGVRTAATCGSLPHVPLNPRSAHSFSRRLHCCRRRNLVLECGMGSNKETFFSSNGLPARRLAHALQSFSTSCSCYAVHVICCRIAYFTKLMIQSSGCSSLAASTINIRLMAEYPLILYRSSQS